MARDQGRLFWGHCYFDQSRSMLICSMYQDSKECFIWKHIFVIKKNFKSHLFHLVLPFYRWGNQAPKNLTYLDDPVTRFIFLPSPPHTCLDFTVNYLKVYRSLHKVPSATLTQIRKSEDLASSPEYIKKLLYNFNIQLFWAQASCLKNEDDNTWTPSWRVVVRLWGADSNKMQNCFDYYKTPSFYLWDLKKKKKSIVTI